MPQRFSRSSLRGIYGSSSSYFTVNSTCSSSPSECPPDRPPVLTPQRCGSIARSFARIHETNLKKQGVLALTFAEPLDYAKVQQDDTIDVLCANVAPGVPVDVVLHHTDGTTDTISAVHTYNEQQLAWFRAGSALNYLCRK